MKTFGGVFARRRRKFFGEFLPAAGENFFSGYFENLKKNPDVLILRSALSNRWLETAAKSSVTKPRENYK